MGHLTKAIDIPEPIQYFLLFADPQGIPLIKPYLGARESTFDQYFLGTDAPPNVCGVPPKGNSNF